MAAEEKAAAMEAGENLGSDDPEALFSVDEFGMALNQEAATVELRLMFISVLSSSYLAQLDKGDLDGRFGYTTYALLTSLQFACDHVNQGGALNDWEAALRLSHISHKDPARYLLAKCTPGMHQMYNWPWHASDGHLALASIGAQTICPQMYTWHASDVQRALACIRWTPGPGKHRRPNRLSSDVHLACIRCTTGPGMHRRPRARPDLILKVEFGGHSTHAGVFGAGDKDVVKESDIQLDMAVKTLLAIDRWG
eukprot:gene12814-7456_t